MSTLWWLRGLEPPRFKIDGIGGGPITISSLKYEVDARIRRLGGSAYVVDGRCGLRNLAIVTEADTNIRRTHNDSKARHILLHP